jgi:hypothetical protein
VVRSSARAMTLDREPVRLVANLLQRVERMIRRKLSVVAIRDDILLARLARRPSRSR